MVTQLKNVEKSAFSVPALVWKRRYVFLTGATGMLGAYFLRELLLQGQQVAVLVRPHRRQNAESRIETLLSLWENGRSPLPRPLVIEGDLCRKDWTERYSVWFRQNVETVIHSAASLSFYGQSDAEPYLTNRNGTKNVLALCRSAEIREFHHISTAYVAGTQRFFTEKDCEVRQKFRNDYERSKIAAERLVRTFGFESLTVYRPSIVIGDTRNGYTATFSGLYAALKLVHTLVSRLSLGSTSAKMALRFLGMNGNEQKNLVPVDWVASVLTHIFTHRELHGKTYHLTNPDPPKMKLVAQTIQQTVEHFSALASENDQMRCSEEWFRENFMTQMTLFRAYLNEDAHFDSTNTQLAAPQFPCPRVDSELLMFLFRRAIESHFGKTWEFLKTKPQSDTRACWSSE